MNDPRTDFVATDALGPAAVMQFADSHTGLRAVLVVDNVAAGPAIGGVRMALDVTVDECLRLARAMTLKNAMAGLPHGGGKSVIAADPGLPAADRARLITAFAHAIADVRDYIPGPDMGTNEAAMARVHATIGRAVGLPRVLGGIPLDEIGATAHGLVAALEAAAPHAGVSVDGARVVIQGFGAVGQHAARLLGARGARLIAVSDSRGARLCEQGFDVAALLALKAGGGSVGDCRQGTELSHADLLGVPCDVWIPAARPDVIRADNVGSMDTRIVLQGANIPATASAEQTLADRGVLVLPDFVANAGGVICAAVEYHNGSEAQALSHIDQRIRTNVSELLAQVESSGATPREVAIAIASKRVAEAMSYRQQPAQ